MLSYNLSESQGPLYKTLYQFIRQDIQQGKLKANEKIPSKRMLAKNLGVSIISIENAYEQLICEGYIYAIPKKGYYVSELENINQLKAAAKKVSSNSLKVHSDLEKISITNNFFDFSSNQIENANFPFSVWTKLLRETIAKKEKELLQVSPCCGVRELQEAIAAHLESFRGMNVNPEQIIIGAGTEYLYGLLIKLLGNDKVYCIENPGYIKLKKIYEINNCKCITVDMDSNGLSVDELRKVNGQIAHISPTHHFPTGICMPASRRYELLAWTNEDANNFIIEDDYDSEFRLKGKPIPSLYSLDVFDKVIYMNTFSKSLTSTIRISYMILPKQLANVFYQKLSFYSCTVSTFEQFTLAAFISQGYFEKHINRMRLHYGRKRNQIIEIIKNELDESKYSIIENDSGLHFILQFNTDKTDTQIKKMLYKNGIVIKSVTDYEMNGKSSDKHQFILNYSNIDVEKLKKALSFLIPII